MRRGHDSRPSDRIRPADHRADRKRPLRSRLQQHIQNQQNPFSRTVPWLDNSRPSHLDPARPGNPERSAIDVITITGQTEVIVEPYGYTVELINLKTRHVFPPITVGAFPTAVAITA
jgi:hypothetical protein